MKGKSAFSALVFAVFLMYGVALAEEIPNPGLIGNRRAELEAELASIEKQIEGFRVLIQQTQGTAQSLLRDIKILDAQIAKAKLEIKARTISIGNIQGAIIIKTKLIGSLDEKIGREQISLAELLRKLQEIDDVSTVEALLAYESLSDFFVESDSFNMIQGALQESFNEIRNDKNDAADQREDLETRRAEELQLRTLQDLERKRIEEREAEKKKILATTKGQEKAYQKLLTDRAKDAASIRSQLFILNGSPSIPFERALEYAKVAEKATGVRPAFLLGIIAEESNLGENVGKGNWTTDLSHERCSKQRTAFVDITSRLGLNPDLVPVSKRAWYGYCGGAMGPAQFIPTTWLLFEDSVSAITNNVPANPWNPLDAFVASALLLRDNGAGARTYTAEHTAALKYLAGSNWRKPAYRFYGDDVMGLAQKYQDQINLLNQVAKR